MYPKQPCTYKKYWPCFLSRPLFITAFSTAFRGITRIIRAKGWRRSIGLPYRYKYPHGNVSVYMYAEAREVWRHAPPGKIFEFDAVRWHLRLFSGPKNITTNPCFSPDLVTWERHERANHTSQSEFCLVFSVFQATTAKNMWPLWSGVC